MRWVGQQRGTPAQQRLRWLLWTRDGAKKAYLPFFAMPFCTKNDRFTKTGSGQTY
jgi:hypothetical protein